jgi:putative endonuclease
MSETFYRHLSNHKGFTGCAPDWDLRWSKEFESKIQALQFERKIKGWKSRLMIERLISES